MRLPLSRATALIALIAALVTASGLAPARIGPGGGRDRALRAIRSGPQRLDSPDGPLHCHEETEAVSVPAGLVVGGPAHADAAPLPGPDESTPPAILPYAPLSPRFPTRISPDARHPIASGRDRALQPPGRAPPAA